MANIVGLFTALNGPATLFLVILYAMRLESRSLCLIVNNFAKDVLYAREFSDDYRFDMLPAPMAFTRM